MNLAFVGLVMMLQATTVMAGDFSELPLKTTLQQFGPGDFGGVRLVTFSLLETFNPVKRSVLRLYGAPDEASGGLLTEIQAYATDNPAAAPLTLERVNMADCSARQLVLGTLGAGRTVVLGEAVRAHPAGGGGRPVSQADPEQQHLRLFILTRNGSDTPGRTPLHFRLIKESDTSKALCEPDEVRDALKSELARLDLPAKAP
jgi:hypothetical protein